MSIGAFGDISPMDHERISMIADWHKSEIVHSPAATLDLWNLKATLNLERASRSRAV
jgi:hypothetical protein